MAVLLASGATEAASSTFALAAGESATLALFDAAGPGLPDDAQVDVQIAASNSEYINIGSLTRNEPSKVLTAVGTFRVLRQRCSAAFGVDKN